MDSLVDDLDRAMDIDWNAAKAAALEAARQAGEILRSMLNGVDVREKGANDLVTDADLAAQRAIESLLLDRFPGHAFLGEESVDTLVSASDAWQWVVDPIDGTTNYAHGLRGFCVSIALLYGRKPMLGVILDPMAHEVFFAISGKGAFLGDARTGNGMEQRIIPASCKGLDKALVAVSFPPRLNPDSPEIRHFLEILFHAQSVRRLGSAALNLCYVASGRLDAYFGSQLKVWDLAAATLIASEAGVQLSRFDGSEFDPWNGEIAAAATPPLLEELLQKLRVSK